MADLICCELLKLKRSKMLLISFLGACVTPAMMVLDGIKIHYSHPEKVITLADLYDSCSLYTMMLFGLIVYAVIAAYLFSREHTEQTLKTILTVPVSKHLFLVSKFMILFLWILSLTLVSWGVLLLLSVSLGGIFGLEGVCLKVAASYLGEMLLGGVLMFLTISPFAFLALWTKGLAVPIIASATIMMGNAALSNEALGAYYPWTASLLLVNGRLADTGCPYWIAVSLLALVSILGFASAFLFFQREDIK